jgi:hypothetical protein
MLTPKNQAGSYKKSEPVDKKKMYQDTAYVSAKPKIKPTPMPVDKAKEVALKISSALKG